MGIGYFIFVGYAFLGLAYAPSLESLTALAFVAASCSPLLLAARRDERAVEIPPPHVVTYWAILAIGFLNLVLIAQRVGRDLSDLASVGGIATVAALSTTARYADSASTGNPILLALSLWLVFRVGVSRVSPVKQGLAVLPLALYTLITTEKWTLYLAGIFFFTGLLVGSPRRSALRRAAVYLSCVIPPMTVLAGASLVLRGRSNDFVQLGVNLLHYLFAQYTALGTWLIHHAGQACCSLGIYTFVGPLDAVGLVTRRSGVFGGQVTVHGIETNIFTAFRYVVEDFSLLGPFLLASGVTALYLALHGLKAWMLLSQIKALVIFAALMSITTTPFTYNSVAFAVLICLASVALSRLPLPVGVIRELRRSLRTRPTGAEAGAHAPGE